MSLKSVNLPEEMPTNLVNTAAGVPGYLYQVGKNTKYSTESYREQFYYFGQVLASFC